MGKKALEGTKVLEYASFVSGPYCSKLLADLGAEVIKIERPGVGDKARERGPFPEDLPHPEKSGLFLYLNTSKKGITLDPKSTTGKKMFLELVKWADILIEDKPPKEMEGLGFTYEELKEVNQQLIMTSITPYGETGPYRDYKAYHLNICHVGGLGYLMPPNSPSLEREPLKAGGHSVDCACGVNAALATVSALYSRGVTGEGQSIDVSKQESLMNLVRVYAVAYANDKVNPNRGPIMGTAAAMGGLKKCKDGYIIATLAERPHWARFFKLIGKPEWDEDERFKDTLAIADHYNEIDPYISEWMMSRTRYEIYHQGQELGCPIAPVRSIDEVVNDPQLKGRDFFVEVDHPEAGKTVFPRGPYVFSETPWQGNPAPLLGQHNEEIYCQKLGYTKEDMVRLRESGII